MQIADAMSLARRERTVANANLHASARMEDHVIPYTENATAQEDGR